MSGGSDPYLYSGTSVLRNVPGLRNPEQLAAFETAKAARRFCQHLLPASRGVSRARVAIGQIATELADIV